MKETSKRGHRFLKSPVARPFLLGVFVLAVVAALLVPVYVLRNTMLSQLAGTPTHVGTGVHAAAVTPGSLTRFVCQVTSTPAENRMNGRILKANSDGSYSSTGSNISIQWDPNRPLAMGSRQDVHPGAILQVSGSVDTGGVVHAGQIVILTGIVTVR